MASPRLGQGLLLQRRQDGATQDLRDEIAALLAEALRLADSTHVETDRVQHVHDDELRAARERHDQAMTDEQQVHDDAMCNMDLALASRDIFGQAKGIIMATMRCQASTAFDLIRKQSQAENRKALDVATEIVARVSLRANI